MNNFDLYKLLNFTVNKDVYAQAISPPEFGLELVAKNMIHFRRRLGLPETYIPGSANEGVGVTRLSDGDLLPFLVVETLNPVNGILSLDSEWYYIVTFYATNSITSDLVGNDEWSDRRNNYITRPTTEHLAAKIIPQGLKILPLTIRNVTVEYYRIPVTPVFVTGVNTTTLEMTYNTTSSVELEWDDGNKLDILSLILQDFGLNLQRSDVQQMANKLIQTGK